MVGQDPRSVRKFFTLEDPVVPLLHPRLVVETAAQQGADRKALLEGTDVNEAMLASPDARISYIQFGLLTRNALRLTGNPTLGLDVGRNLHLPHMGMLGLAIMSSGTAGAALGATLRHHKRVAPGWDLSLEVDGAIGRFIATEAISFTPFQAFATEMLLAAFDTQASMLIGRKLPIVRISLCYPAPPHAERYRQAHDVPVLFDQRRTEVEFESSLLQEPLAFSEPATAKLAEQYFAEHPAQHAATDGLILQVRKRLLAARGKPPDVGQLARELQTSERSLRRGLQELGTSYQELLDEMRRERAIEWARSTAMSFDQIASQLGFSDVRIQALDRTHAERAAR